MSADVKSTETVLLMLSGGLDSTYMLYHYLTQTNLNVHAHHISIRYPHLCRWPAEDEAVRRIVAECRRTYRDFEYSESFFGFDFRQHVGWDSDLQLLVASKVAPNLKADWVTVALGWCVEDMQRPEVAERASRLVTPNLWSALRASINVRTNINPCLAMPLVEQGVTKADVLRRLPRELVNLCWSCRGPVISAEKTVPCGQCHACRLNVATIRNSGLDCADFPNLAPAAAVADSAAPSQGWRVVARMPGALPMGDWAQDVPIYGLVPPPPEFSLGDRHELRPARSDIELGGKLAFLIDNVLAPDEADMLVRVTEQLGYGDATPGIKNPPGVRMNKAVHWVSDDTFLGSIFRRIGHLLPSSLENRPLHSRLSHRVNMYKYDKGDVFNRHVDGDWPGYGLSPDGRCMVEWPDTRSMLTMLLYLNGPADGVEGGGTRLFSSDGGAVEVVPRKGSALLFRHGYGVDSVLHEGAQVTGVAPKYVAKINVLYETAAPNRPAEAFGRQSC